MLRGSIIAIWAGIESILVQANYVSWSVSHQRVGAQVPVGFKDKVRFFRKAHREVALMKPVAADGGALLQRLLPLLDDRQFLVHGYLIPEQSTRSTFRVNRHEFAKGGLKTVGRTFTNVELNGLLDELVDIAEQASTYMGLVTRELIDNFQTEYKANEKIVRLEIG